MKILVAQHSGFCYGVKRAVKMLESLIETEGDVYTLGPLIHNQQVIEHYSNKGVVTIDSITELNTIQSKNSKVIIRSHGAPKSVYDEAEAAKINIHDATCPYVKKIQNTVSTYASKGYNIIIVGNAMHPEVVGINGWCDNRATIIESVEQVELIEQIMEPTCVVVQTTFSMKKWNTISHALQSRLKALKVFNTICLATEQRQQAVLELAKEVDLMIVVGGLHSSNTVKLAQLCREQVKTIHIETKDDLKSDDLIGTEVVGITAGASTPDWIIQSVILKIENEGEVFF